MLPRDHRLTVVTHAVPDRGPARRQPPHRAAPAARPGPPPPPRPRSAPTPSRPSTTSAPTSPSSAPTASPSTTGCPPPTATRPPPSGPSSQRAAQVVVLADSSKIGVERTVRFADARRRRRPRHRRRHRRRRPQGPRARPGSRSSSHDPHPHPQPQQRPHRHARRRRCERGAVQRAASVISQAGGKGVNISRASVAAGVAADRRAARAPRTTRSSTSCSPPASTAARSPPAGDLRVNLTITEPDGTTTKLNSPGADDDRRAPRPASPTRCVAAPATARLGRAGRLAAARAPPSAGTPTWCAPCATPAPGSRSTPATPRCAPWSTALPDARART